MKICYGKYGLIVTVFVFYAVLFFASEPASLKNAGAFKPNTHILTGNIAIGNILQGADNVVINATSYPVDHRIADAIRSYPDYYRGGLVGPDGFPDIFFGQSVIHPDSKCDNGRLPDNLCEMGPGHSFSHEWLRHIYDSAWDYYDVRNGDEEAKKALAFSYGFLTHAAGDMWAHTFVNDFAEGVFPGPLEIKDDPALLPHATRHIIVEGYIGQHTPNTNLTINSPSDFIYRTFIDPNFVDSKGQTTKALGQGEIFNYFYSLRDRLSQSSSSLQNEANQLQQKADRCKWDDFSCSSFWLLGQKEVKVQTKAYVDAWIEDIDSGLAAWPTMSQNVAYNLFSNPSEDHIDKALNVVDGFIGTHMLSMLGAPDKVGSAYNLIGSVGNFVTQLLGDVVKPVKDFRNYAILQTTGLNIPAFKEFYSNPANYINTPGSVTIAGQTINIGLEQDTSEKIDSLMNIQNGFGNPNIKFDPEKFAAVKNTITLAKLLLLSPQSFNDLVMGYGTPSPVYPSGENGVGQSNAMLDYIRSLDSNDQWRLNSIRSGDIREDGTPRQHGDGMPIWLECSTRDMVFRNLFVDWRNEEFPDFGEQCRTTPAP